MIVDDASSSAHAEMTDGLWFYNSFDITLASDTPLDELPRVPLSAPDWFFRLRDPRPQSDVYHWFHEWREEDQEPSVRFGRAGSAYVLRCPGIVDFLLDDQISTVDAFPLPGACGATVRHLFVDLILPLTIAQRNSLVIHASAVVGRDGKAICFVGPSGYGKSTIVAALANEGYSLLTDDGLLLVERSGEWHVVPSYPAIRIYQDSFDAIFGNVPGQTLSASKRRIALRESGIMAERQAVRLGRLYILEPPGLNCMTITPSRPLDAFIALLKNTFHLDIFDTGFVASNFGRYSRCIRQCPFYRLDYPRELQRLPELASALGAHSERPDPSTGTSR